MSGKITVEGIKYQSIDIVELCSCVSGMGHCIFLEFTLRKHTHPHTMLSCFQVTLIGREQH